MGFLMKRPKTIPRKFKECLSAYYLNPEQWILVEEWEFYIKIARKDNLNKVRFLDKYRQEMKKIEKSNSKGKSSNDRCLVENGNPV